MASIQSIAVVTNAIVGHLRRSLVGRLGEEEILARRTTDLATPPARGVTVCLYRVAHNQTLRNISVPPDARGRRTLPPTPLDLHYLVTAWAGEAELQQELLARVARSLDDAPVLDAGFLNGIANAEVFRPTESVELVAAALSLADMVSVWEMAKAQMQPSLTYIARMVLIDSDVELAPAVPVQSRALASPTSVPR